MTMIEFEEMTFTVRKETADNIRHLSKVSGMNNGEVIETALMNLSAKNSDVAPILALQEILMMQILLLHTKTLQKVEQEFYQLLMIIDYRYSLSKQTQWLKSKKY